MTKAEEMFYNDIHRIANALEKIAKNTEITRNASFSKVEIVPLSDKTNYFNQSCKGCWYYEYVLKTNTIPEGDSPCNWCSKMQPYTISNARSNK